MRAKVLVGLDRLELSTSPLSGVRSSHLSYRPGSLKPLRAPKNARRGPRRWPPGQSRSSLVELVGIEPATS